MLPKNGVIKKTSQVEFMQHNKPYYECYLCFKDATKFIINLVEDRKSVPKIVMNSSDKTIITMFVKGFSDSEGTIIRQKLGRNCLKIYNQKKVILNQIKSMLLKLGFDKKKVYVVVNNKTRGGVIYAIRICYKDQLKLFHEKIGFIIQRKQQKLEKCIK